MGLVRLDEHKDRVRGAGGNREVPRTDSGRPRIRVMLPSPTKRQPDRKKEGLRVYTRMTTWIDCLDDKSAIRDWQRRMVLIGLASVPRDEREALVAEILALDPVLDKGKLNAIAERMHVRAGGNAKADKGDELHGYSEYVDRGEAIPLTATEADLLDMAAYKLATLDLQVKEIEHFVVLDEFKVGGTPDRMSFYDGLDPDGQPAGHLITDLKTGRVDYGGLKMCMQLAGYAHARPYHPNAEKFEDTRTDWPEDINLRWGLIINAPAGTGTCEVMWVDLTLGWRGFLLCKEVRAIRNEGRNAFRTFPSPLPTLASESDEGEEDE